MVLAAAVLGGCAPEFGIHAPTSASQDSLHAPQIPDGFLFRPVFETTQGTIRAGTAFVVALPGSTTPVVVTALHLLGPAGGLPKDVAAKDVSRAVRNVSLVGLFDESLRLDIGGGALEIGDAAPLGKQSAAGDILTFRASPRERLAALPLAVRVPDSGAPVWLAARLVQGAPATQRLHRATSQGMDRNGDFRYRFDGGPLSLRATSGAPVLNAAGEVVAIHLGGGSSGGQTFGIGNPVDRFRQFLEREAKRSE